MKEFILKKTKIFHEDYTCMYMYVGAFHNHDLIRGFQKLPPPPQKNRNRNLHILFYSFI